MFTLRKITGNGVEINANLGESYTVVDSERSKEEFNKILEEDEYYKSEREIIYGFVIKEGGADIFCLFSTQKNYIVGATGKTYDNLTKK